MGLGKFERKLTDKKHKSMLFTLLNRYHMTTFFFWQCDLVLVHSSSGHHESAYFHLMGNAQF